MVASQTRLALHLRNQLFHYLGVHLLLVLGVNLRYFADDGPDVYAAPGPIFAEVQFGSSIVVLLYLLAGLVEDVEPTKMYALH